MTMDRNNLTQIKQGRYCPLCEMKLGRLEQRCPNCGKYAWNRPVVTLILILAGAGLLMMLYILVSAL